MLHLKSRNMNIDRYKCKPGKNNTAFTAKTEIATRDVYSSFEIYKSVAEDDKFFIR